MAGKLSGVPDHVAATVAAISDLHAEHYRKSGRIQRLVALTTAFVARPRTLFLMTVAIVGWVLLNLGLLIGGFRVLDEPPFPYLADAASIVALYLTTIILITQSHDDDLATRRDRMTLELAILSEQKSTEIIGLLEELRRAMDVGRDGDGHVQTLAEPTGPQDMLDRLQAAHEALDKPVD